MQTVRRRQSKHMADRIEFPPFPPLTLSVWNDEGGELRGTGLFPHWATLQSDAPPNRCEDSGDGSFDVTVNTPAGAHDRPAVEQIAAFQHLCENASPIFNDILRSVFDEYDWVQDEFAECFTPEDAAIFAPKLSAPIELLPLLSFGTMYVHRVFADGLAYIGIALGCTWDQEHGLGILIHGSKIVSVGGWDTSFMEWIPESDAQGDA